MGDLKNAKIFGGIGSILMLVGAFIPMIGVILPFIGLILVIIAVKNIADETKDGSIFKNYLLFFLLDIVATIALAALMFILISGTIGWSYLDLITSQTGGQLDPTAFTSDLGALIGGCLIALVVFWIIMIIAAIFLRKSFTSITQHTSVKLFATTGLVYLIGAATIIIGIGFIIMIIAFIMQIIAFFSLPDVLPTGTPGIAGQQPGRICPNCGRPIPMDSQVCPYCGKDFRPPTKL